MVFFLVTYHLFPVTFSLSPAQAFKNSEDVISFNFDNTVNVRVVGVGIASLGSDVADEGGKPLH